MGDEVQMLPAAFLWHDMYVARGIAPIFHVKIRGISFRVAAPPQRLPLLSAHLHETTFWTPRWSIRWGRKSPCKWGRSAGSWRSCACPPCKDGRVSGTIRKAAENCSERHGPRRGSRTGHVLRHPKKLSKRLLVKHWIVIAYAVSCCLLPKQTP